MLRRISFLTLFLAVSGCMADKVRARAAHDLECPREEVTVAKLDETWAAEGCGKKAEFLCAGRAEGTVVCHTVDR
jgi:hypothetical protein